MNIESTGVNTSNSANQAIPTTNSQANLESSVKFADELKGLEAEKSPKSEINNEKEFVLKEKPEKEEKTNKVLNTLNKTVKEINQLDDKEPKSIKKDAILADKETMINNDFNIENKDLLPQMNPNMSFNSNGQPFSSLMGEEAQKKSEAILSATASELAEEAAILSTMAENIAIANRNLSLNQNEKIVDKNNVSEINPQTKVLPENIVKFDSIIMNEADVEVFSALVQDGVASVNNLAPESVEKGVQVSKTLANMLAKTMETNQPVRIDFDNNISVIIRISRDGKITADFLPSSQVAEAYLKENLPLLRQKFDNENIKYDELNQRERREHQKDNNRKKGRNDE